MSRETPVRFCERREVRLLPATHLVVMVWGARKDAEALWDEVSMVLAPIGLRLSAEKTRVCHIDEGFDFLGYRIQRRSWRGRPGKKAVYTYPSKKAVASVVAKVRALTRRNMHRTLAALLHRLNRVLRGWCNYFRHGVSSRTFSYLNYCAVWRVVGWIRKRHDGPNWSTFRRRHLPNWEIRDGNVAMLHPGGSRSSDTATGAHASRHHGQASNEPVETRIGGEVYVRFGGRAEETDRLKSRHRASVRPLPVRRHRRRPAVEVALCR
jgi:hypothetical protein